MWDFLGRHCLPKYFSTQRALEKVCTHTVWTPLLVRTSVKIMHFSCIFQKTLDAGRIGIAAQGLGIAQVKHDDSYFSKCF